MGALKDRIDSESVAALGDIVAERVPGLDRVRFSREAGAGLGGLELKARIAHVADALEAALPGPFAAAAPGVAAAVGGSDLSAWQAWPALTWVEQAGLGDPEIALAALAAMTGHASAEFAVRPFIAAHPDLAWARLNEWAAAPDEHLRRLASEGTRPRLPWGSKVASLSAEPERGLALLDRLRDDPSEYVRRSVANHLNDVARDHPELAIATARRWTDAGGEHVGAVVRHALRGLVKRGDGKALALIGADVDAAIEAVLEPAAATAVIGGALPFAVTLTAAGDRPVTAVVDYAVLYARPSGRSSRKVFKLATVELQPGVPRRLERTLRLADVSIRTHHPGEHGIELLVNGSIAASASFVLDRA